jgi:hypothetical protein
MDLVLSRFRRRKRSLHSIAPPLQNRPASLGSVLIFGETGF